MTDAARREDSGDVLEGLSQTVAHFMNVIPLLFRNGRANVVGRHLSLVEEPLKDEQRGCVFVNMNYIIIDI